MMHANNRSVTVDRLKLIEQLKANLIQHTKDYAEATIGYRIKLKQDLENALEFFDEKPYNVIAKLSVPSNPPKSYEKEYIDAIAMLEWSVSETIDLDQSLFKNYVQNEWAWSGQFDIMNTTYKAFAEGAVGSARRG
jgi:hypothetical protein